MSQIPSYALYGEVFDNKVFSSINIERIRRRSEPHDWNIQPHQHGNMMQVLFVETKDGTAFFDGKAIEFTAPCFLIIPSGTVHGFKFRPGIDGYVITVGQQQVESIISNSSFNFSNLFNLARVIPLDQGDRAIEVITSLFELTEYESNFAESGAFHACNMLIGTLLLNASRAAEKATRAEHTQGSRKSDLVERFRIAVNDSRGCGKSVNDYAEQLGITPSHLRRICQEVLGESPLAVINQRLILAAQRELAYSSMTVQQVAYSLEFEDSAYFSRFFRKQTGMTPSEFRLSIEL